MVNGTIQYYLNNNMLFLYSSYEWDDISFFEVDEYENISTLNSNLKLLSNLMQAFSF
jgi:hypothetical protein